MTTSTDTSPREYFPEEKTGRAVMNAMALKIRQRMDNIVAEYISRDNIQHLRHGGVWSHPANKDVFDGGIREHSAFVQTSFEEIISNDLNSIERFTQQMTDAMTREFMRTLYDTVTASCESVGNVVSASPNVPMWQLIFDTLQKIEFGVGEDGAVQLPQLHAAPDTLVNLNESLASAPPDFKQRIDDLVAKKTGEAIEREAIRRKKFARYGSDT